MNISETIKNKQFINSLWMMSEKIIAIFGMLFVTSYVARYIGVEAFGQLALAIALFQIVQVIAQMGSDNIIFKRFTQNITSGLRLISATLLQRVLIYLLLSLPILLWQIYTFTPLGFSFFIAIFFASLFSTLDVYSIYFNATLQSRFNTLANSAGLLAGFISRYLIVWFALSPFWLSISIMLTSFIPLLLRRYRTRTLHTSMRLPARQQKRYRHYLFRTGFSLVISSISVAIYGRISQLMLAMMAGSKAVGLFAVASSLATSWTFVTAALITSSFTTIFQSKSEAAALLAAARLQRLIFAVSLFFVLLLSLMSYPVLKILYGEAYLEGWPIIILLAVASFFSASGPVAYRYIIRLSGYRFLTRKSFLLLCISVPTSAIAIYFWGIYGAAASTILIELVGLTLLNYAFSHGVIWTMHKKSMGYRSY